MDSILMFGRGGSSNNGEHVGDAVELLLDLRVPIPGRMYDARRLVERVTSQ